MTKRLTLITSLTHPSGRTITSSSDGITWGLVVTAALQLTVDAVVATRTRYTSTFHRQFYLRSSSEIIINTNDTPVDSSSSSSSSRVYLP